MNKDNFISELINYLMEFIGDDDFVCTELLTDENEKKYCAENCQNLNENCITRLINNRLKNKN